MIKVERATLLDVKELEEISREYYEESGHLPQALTYDSEAATNSLCSILVDEESLILVAKDDDVIIGYMWLIITKPYYSNDLIMNEQYMFIKKPYRKSRAFALLIRAAQVISKESGCDYLQVGDSTNGELHRTLSKRCTLIGTMYLIRTH